MELKRGTKRVSNTSLPDGKDNYVKVMAVADNYVMARHPHCVPFVLQTNKFNEKYYIEWEGEK